MSDEPVDPKPALEEECKPSCKTLWQDYEACARRIAEKGSGECSGQFIDFQACIDKCAMPKLGRLLK